jgi:hypothetical protein
MDVNALIEEFAAHEQCARDAAMRIIAVVAAALGFHSVAGFPDLLSTIWAETVAAPGARSRAGGRRGDPRRCGS